METTSEFVHPLVDTSAVYKHVLSGLRGRVEDWAEDPDGKVKIRIKDKWLFLDDCTKVKMVRCPHCFHDFELVRHA